MDIDELLRKRGIKLTYNQLTNEERDTLNGWLTQLNQGQLTVDRIRDHITAMRVSVENELIGRKDTPQNFITLLTYLIPIIGLIRKWYIDQYDMSLKARLRELVLIESFLYSPIKAKAQLDEALDRLGGGVGWKDQR